MSTPTPPLAGATETSGLLLVPALERIAGKPLAPEIRTASAAASRRLLAWFSRRERQNDQNGLWFQRLITTPGFRR